MFGVVMRVVVCVVLVVCFLVAVVYAEQKTIELSSKKYEILNLPENFHEIRMKDFGNLLVPGKPMLPAKTFLIAIPPGSEINSVNIVESQKEKIGGSYNIIPAPLQLPMDEKAKLVEEAEKNYKNNIAEVYFTNRNYPEKNCWFDGEGSYRDVNFARIVFTPFSYNPVTNELFLCSKVVINFTYSLSMENKSKVPHFSSTLKNLTFAKTEQELFYNYDDVIKWREKSAETFTSAVNYDYVIITTDALQNSVSSLVAWKQSVGYSVTIISDSWINDSYSGTDLPEKIRNFLKDKYLEWGIQYVLLVGDINDIPMRKCCPKANTTSEETPTDYYYADLTGNWDSDGDGRFGEYGQDSVDWVPEVLVGRIPWSDYNTVVQICDKLVNFESDKGAWKKDALLLGAMSNYANENRSGYTKTDGATLMEIHKTLIQDIGGNFTTMYETAGLEPSNFSCSMDLTHTNVVNDWANGKYAMVNWWAHGSKTGAYRKWWASDDGDNVPESSEMNWQAMIATNDCPALNDNYPSIIFACSCNNGWPESTNLGKEMIRNGSSGIVSSSRVSWYSVGWSHQNHGGNASMDYYFFHYLINEENRVGEALYNSKVYYSTHFMYSSWGWVCWQNMFDFNLYGDPALHRPGLTGTEVTHTISGNVKYYSSGIPVSSTNVQLSGGQEQSQTTDVSGAYQFTSLNPGADYNLIAEKETPINEDCINGFDAALTARIATGLITEPTDEQLKAADVDKNGNVQMYDASLIAMFSVGLPNSPESSVNEWAFNPLDRVYPELNSDYTEQDFAAIVLGDVDANWMPDNYLMKESIQKKNYQYLSDAEVLPGENIVVPIIAGENKVIYSFDICISFDPNHLKTGIMEKSENLNNFQMYVNKSQPGKLLISAFSVSPLKEAGKFLEIVFNTMEGNNKETVLSLDYYRINNDQLFTASSQIKIANTELQSIPDTYCLLQNYPNPFNPETCIRFEIPEKANVKLSIYNMLGQKIRTLAHGEKNAGKYQVFWDGKNDFNHPVSSGLYIYKINVGKFSQIKKMFLMR